MHKKRPSDQYLVDERIHHLFDAMYERWSRFHHCFPCRFGGNVARLQFSFHCFNESYCFVVTGRCEGFCPFTVANIWFGWLFWFDVCFLWESAFCATTNSCRSLFAVMSVYKTWIKSNDTNNKTATFTHQMNLHFGLEHSWQLWFATTYNTKRSELYEPRSFSVVHCWNLRMETKNNYIPAFP